MASARRCRGVARRRLRQTWSCLQVLSTRDKQSCCPPQHVPVALATGSTWLCAPRAPHHGRAAARCARHVALDRNVSAPLPVVGQPVRASNSRRALAICCARHLPQQAGRRRHLAGSVCRARTRSACPDQHVLALCEPAKHSMCGQARHIVCGLALHSVCVPAKHVCQDLPGRKALVALLLHGTQPMPIGWNAYLRHNCKSTTNGRLQNGMWCPAVKVRPCIHAVVCD
jgi:hypothetical protein